MFRSFSNRLLGGVCGGLGQRTPLPAWGWRILFLLLTALTAGAGALVYLLLWWLFPLDSPLDTARGGALRGLVGLLLSAGLIAGYIFRAEIQTAAEADIFWPLALLLLALVFLYRQFQMPSGGNLLVGLVAVAVPLLVLAGLLGVYPAGIQDTLLRAWPALLLFFGLMIALRQRVKFGGIVALALTLLITGGLILTAYSTRSGQQRTENQVIIEETLPDSITTLQINLNTLDTDVQIVAAAGDTRTLLAEFSGSNNRRIEQDYNEETGLVSLTLREIQISDFPALDDVGRSTFEIQIPQDVALGMAFEGDSGEARLDMAALDLERLSFDLYSGDVLVTLPRYQPVSPSVADNPGSWLVRDGNLSVVVPQELGVRFVLNRNRNPEPRPEQNFNDLYYTVELNPDAYILTSRRFDALDERVQYIVDVPNGTLRLVTQDGETPTTPDS